MKKLLSVLLAVITFITITAAEPSPSDALKTAAEVQTAVQSLMMEEAESLFHGERGMRGGVIMATTLSFAGEEAMDWAEKASDEEVMTTDMSVVDPLVRGWVRKAAPKAVALLKEVERELGPKAIEEEVADRVQTILEDRMVNLIRRVNAQGRRMRRLVAARK